MADDLIGALKAGEPPPYAKLLADGPKIPDALVALGEDLRKYEGEPENIHEVVLEKWRPHLELRKDEDFRFNRDVKQQGGTNTPAQGLRKWASGEGGYAMNVNLPGVHEFMAELFEVIKASHRGTQTNELDLFHGHVVPNAASKDLAIIFHAKEYPREELEPGGFKEEVFAKAGIVRPGRGRFGVGDPAMTERNFLWLLSENKIWVLSDPNRTGPAPDPKFAQLLQGSDERSKQFGTVAESKFGTDIFNVNYFPEHLEGPKGKQVFFAPVGQWAVLFELGMRFPHVRPEQIKEIYDRTGSSRAKTEEILGGGSSAQNQSPAQVGPAPQPRGGPPPRATQSAAPQPVPVGRLAEMFPNLARDVLQAVLAQCGGDLQRAINALLEM